MNRLILPSLALLSLAMLAGCGPKDPPKAGMNKSMLGLENMTPEERIQKVANDPKIPPGYKETYIRSQQAAAQGQGQTPPPAPTNP